MNSFSPVHIGSLVTILVITSITVLWLRRWRDTEKEELARRFIGYGCLVAWIVSTGYRLIFLPFDWSGSLPLHFCNLANLLGALAVLGKERLSQAILYFWAFALCIWAFITPDLPVGPGSAGFWIFWFYHLFIPLAVVEILVLQRFRPSWTDFRNAITYTLIYLVFLGFLNNLFGWNYGYVGPSQPRIPTILDYLGPYPLRLIWMVMIGAILYLVLLLPWLRK